MKFKNVKTGAILTANNDIAARLMSTSPNFVEVKEAPKTDKKTAKGKEYQTAIHENVHYIAEHNQEGYEQLKNALLDWYKNHSGDKKYNAIKNKYANAYETNGNKMTNAELDEELVADATAAIFTTEDGIEQFAEYVAEKSEPEKKSIKEAFTDLINRIVETIKKALSRGSLSNYQKEYLEMEQKQAEEIRTLFLSSLDKAAENYKSEIQEQADTSEQKNNTAEGDVKYSITVTDDGKTYVSADRKIITGSTVAEMRKEITDFYNNILKNGSVNVTTADGNVLTISKNETAKKARDNYREVHGKRIKLSNTQFRIKLNAAAHIDELAETSSIISKDIKDTKNHDFAKDGFDYYQTYFEDFDKQMYKVIFSVGKNNGIATVYNIGRIKKDNSASAKSIAVVGSKTLVESSNNSISKSDKNVKIKNSFDVDEPVEEVRDLVAVHNITEDKMLKSLELGGLPMPSIAVMEARNAKGNDTFGEISLIFPREAIDPEANFDNKVYGSDVYTPTYPAIEYKINEKKADEIYLRAIKAEDKRLPLEFNCLHFKPTNLTKRNGILSSTNLYDSIDVKLLYLAENDINVEAAENYKSTVELIDKSIDKDDYNKWVDELFDGLIEKEGIRNNKTPYNELDDKRSWEELHYEENLENVVKVMKGQENGRGGGGLKGSWLWSVAAKHYGTIEELKADSERLDNDYSRAEYKKIRENFLDRFKEIVLSITGNDFITYGNASEAVLYALKNVKTRTGLLNCIKEKVFISNQDNVTENTVDDILDLISDVGNMPVGYFEAKPQRALDFNEVATALIPESSSQQLRDGLDNAGVNYIEYDGENENARQDALNDYLENVNDVRFSLDVDEYDIDEYDETEYNNVTLSSREYNQLQSEVMTNYSQKTNVVNEIRLASTDSIYTYILDENRNLTVYSKRKISESKKRKDIRNVDRNGDEISGNNEVSGYGRELHNRNAGVTLHGERTKSNAQFDSIEVSEKGRSDEAGHQQNNNYDDGNEKNSIDVEGENRRLRRENEKLNEILKLQKHELELTTAIKLK